METQQTVYQLPQLIDLQYLMRDAMQHALKQANEATLPEIESRFIMWANQCYQVIEEIQNLINYKLCTQPFNNSQIHITISDCLLKPTEKGYMLTPAKPGTMKCMQMNAGTI
jgi:hypothetical protein